MVLIYNIVSSLRVDKRVDALEIGLKTPSNESAQAILQIEEHQINHRHNLV